MGGRQIIGLEQLAAIASRARLRDKTIALCHGTFDLPHMGHIRRIIKHLRRPEHADLLPHFARSAAFFHFGANAAEAVLKAPECWDAVHTMLLQEPLREYMSRKSLRVKGEGRTRNRPHFSRPSTWQKYVVQYRPEFLRPRLDALVREWNPRGSSGAHLRSGRGKSISLSPEWLGSQRGSVGRLVEQAWVSHRSVRRRRDHVESLQVDKHCGCPTGRVRRAGRIRARRADLEPRCGLAHSDRRPRCEHDLDLCQRSERPDSSRACESRANWVRARDPADHTAETFFDLSIPIEGGRVRMGDV